MCWLLHPEVVAPGCARPPPHTPRPLCPVCRHVTYTRVWTHTGDTPGQAEQRELEAAQVLRWLFPLRPRWRWSRAGAARLEPLGRQAERPEPRHKLPEDESACFESRVCVQCDAGIRRRWRPTEEKRRLGEPGDPHPSGAQGRVCPQPLWAVSLRRRTGAECV